MKKTNIFIMNVLQADKSRKGYFPLYQYYFRKATISSIPIMRKYYNRMLKITCFLYSCELYKNTKIGPGLYIGHPYGININPDAQIGCNCSIHKGVTIGQENRGVRRGSPTIGDFVWIGINATIVGNIIIGNDVLIAPNSFVNCNVPSHSIVFGNPCIIKPKQNATEGYIENCIPINEFIIPHNNNN